MPSVHFTSGFVCLAAALFQVTQAAVSSQAYTWNNVRIGGGGGFVPSIVFNPSAKGVAYARTDIGGAYRLNSDDSWTPITDLANDTTWNYWGVDALATDPVATSTVYLAVGAYTNSWDPNTGSILKSTDQGNTWTATKLPFKVGGNDPGRGLGERLSIDPNNNNILYFGARSGNGLWRSTDAGKTWSNVTNFPSVGTYRQDPTDTTGYSSDIMGISWVTFDKNSKTSGGSSRIFVGVANMGTDNVFVSTDSGSTWKSVAGQNNTFIPHKGVLSPAENALYLSYANGIGPYDGTLGFVKKYFIGNSSWLDITPAQGLTDNYYGYGGLAVDLQRPGTVMVAPLNEWYPDADIYRSTDGGATWTGIFNFGYPPPAYQATMSPFYNYDVSRAPWINTFKTGDSKTVGWMIEGLSIDPFDSNHWLYGTGLTVYGGHDLLNWDMSPRKNITLASLATGIEETAVQGLTAPPSGPILVSAVGDVGGFVHTSLTTSPPTFQNPIWAGTVSDVDHAGANPSNIVRLAGFSTTPSSIALSTDGGNTWSPYYASPATTTAYSGKIAISATGDTLLWSQGTGFTGVQVSRYNAPFTTSQGVPNGAAIASDKKNNTVFYAASGSAFYVSTDNGSTFKQTATLGNAQSVTKIAASPFTAGEVFVSTSVGIFHSTNYGTSFVGLPGTTNAWSIAVGAPKTANGTVSLFASATIGGTNALYRTDNLGSDWSTISDSKHGLGSSSSLVLAADPKTYSQVFVGTNGRGIFYGHV